MFIVAIFFVIAVFDRFFGNRLKLGKELEDGFALMGRLALTIVGLISISPLIAKILKPIIVPLYQAIGADPAMFSPTFLSTDSGGYSIAIELAKDPEIGKWGGLVVASMVGAVISFTIPVALGILEEDDVKYFAVGIMAGLFASPIGSFFGGLATGLPIPVLLINLAPVMAVAFLIAIGLILKPHLMIKGFVVFARLISLAIAIGLALAAFEKLTGIALVKGMNPLSEGMGIVGSVATVIAGILPFLKVLMIVLKKPLEKIGELLKIPEISVISFLLALTTVVPVFASFKDMNTKGKVLVAAFTGSAANMLGAHLGFISAVSPDMMIPMFIAKITAGIIALPFAAFLAKLIFKDELVTE